MPEFENSALTLYNIIDEDVTESIGRTSPFTM
jgi:hypothetical protein